MAKKYGFILILMVAVLGIGFFWYEETDPAERTRIKVFGNVEINQVEVSFKIAGRVDKRLVDEGQTVQAGELVAVLDSSELLHELELRQADVAAAEANLLEMSNGYLPEEIAQAHAKNQKAQADLTLQKADYQRQEQLFKQQVISQKEFDTSKALFEKAMAEFHESKEYYALLKKGTRIEKIDKAVANVEQAKQVLTLAEIRLGYANLYSPLTGVVLSKNVEAGEYASAGTPIVTIGNLESVWIRAYVTETDLGLIKLGQTVDVMTDAFPKKIYPGSITFISQEAEFTPKNVQTLKERVKLVYRIKVTVPNPNQELKPGMPADGIIHLES